MADTMKLTLDIKGRIIIRQIVNLRPNETAGMVAHKLYRDIRSKLDIGQEEIEEIGLTDTVDPVSGEPNGGVIWKVEKDVEYEFTTAEVAALKNRIHRLDTEERVPAEWVDTCEKIQSL